MANPVIYAAIDDTIPNREQGEESEKIVVAGDRPELGDTLSMGSDREWRVTRVEAYRSEGKTGKTVYVATVTPEGAEEIEGIPMRVEYPSVAFSVLLSPTEEILSYAWEMEGQLPKGRLMGYKFDEDGAIDEIPLEWVIDQVEKLQPDEEDSTFAAVHLCWCRSEAEVIDSASAA